MFTVLKIEEKASGFFQAIKEKVRPSKPTLQKVAVKGGAPFFLLTVNYEKGEIPWEKVAYHAGRGAKRLVLPESIKPPSDSGVEPFVPEYLPFIILFNNALEKISKDILEPKLRRLTVVDKRGILARHIEKAVESIGEITVITDNRDRYDAVAESILRETGAVIRTVEEFDPFTNYIISECIENIETQAEVFCLEHENVTAENIITLDEIQLPSEYEELRPVTISAITFASALYEMCGVRELERLT